MKNIIASVLFSALAISASAQISTNSPSSMYGLGVLNDRATGFNRGMNGVGVAMSEHNQVNVINPASYSQIDSLTFIFDVGMTGQMSAFTENGKTITANNAGVDYAVASFRLRKHLGMSFGFQPLSFVGYEFAFKDKNVTSYTHTYKGNGGLQEAFLGAGWQPVKNFSVGFNGSYVWGQINNGVTSSSTNTSNNTIYRSYSSNIGTYRFEFGVQYGQNVTAKDRASVGATYSVGHKINRPAYCTVTSVDNMASESYSKDHVLSDAFSLPDIYAVGVAWNHSSKWTIGADYNLQKWGSLKMPLFVNGTDAGYQMVNDVYMDRSRISIGGSVLPNIYSRNFFNRVRYSAGLAYSSPYLKINGHDGPKEYSATVGFAIPVMNAYNNRSVLNISAQWAHAAAKDMINTTTWRINVGITFNERWFAKWKVE